MHKTNRNKIAELMVVVDRDLAASKTPGLHNDWIFNIAYNAALQLATGTPDSGVRSLNRLESVIL